jgi:hypothetical protein
MDMTEDNVTQEQSEKLRKARKRQELKEQLAKSKRLADEQDIKDKFKSM